MFYYQRKVTYNKNENKKYRKTIPHFPALSKLDKQK